MINSKTDSLNFIIGAGRSGTTLLMNILNNHEDICAPPEHDFLLPFLFNFGNKNSLTDKDKSDMIDFLWIRKQESKQLWNIDMDSLKNELIGNNKLNSFKDVYCTILKQYQNNTTANCIIDKNPFYSNYIAKIDSQFQNAKFIAVIRDYRDRFTSIKKIGSALKKNNLIRSLTWVKYNNNIIRYEKEKSNQIHIVRYENLVKNPQEEIQKICTFLNLNFQENMLASQNNIATVKQGEYSNRINAMHADSRREIHQNKINIWKSELTKKEVEELTCYCGKTANHLKYADIPSISFWKKSKTLIKYLPTYIWLSFLTQLKKTSYQLSLKNQKKLVSFFRKKVLSN